MRLIDGDALLKNIRRAVYPSDLTTTIAVGICESHVKDMPTIDAVPVVHGRPVWINPFDPGAKVCTWRCSSICSICGEYVAASWKYCPNCGAKMDDEWRSEDADTP